MKSARMVGVRRQIIDVGVAIGIGRRPIVVVANAPVQRKPVGDSPIILNIGLNIPLPEIGNRYSRSSLSRRWKTQQQVRQVATSYQLLRIVVRSILPVKRKLAAIPNGPVAIHVQLVEFPAKVDVVLAANQVRFIREFIKSLQRTLRDW